MEQDIHQNYTEAVNMRKMRTFYESWQQVFESRAFLTHEIEFVPLPSGNQELEIRALSTHILEDELKQIENLKELL